MKKDKTLPTAEEKIREYQEIIEKSGLYSLRIDQIQDYRTTLEDYKRKLKRNIISDKLITSLFATFSLLCYGHTFSEISDANRLKAYETESANDKAIYEMMADNHSKKATEYTTYGTIGLFGALNWGVESKKDKNEHEWTDKILNQASEEVSRRIR